MALLLGRMAREGREVWAKRVERWRDSGLTLREFAAEVGVNANTLAGWRWRLGPKVAGNERRAERGAPAFVEVVAAPAGSTRSGARGRRFAAASGGSEPLEVVLRSGYRIRVPAEFDPGALRRVLDALEAR